MSKILKTLTGPLSTFAKNRNGRIYTKDLWEGVLNSEYWQDMTQHNTLVGEIVHPGDRVDSDPLEIDARNVSHRVKEAHIEGNKLIGTVEVLDTEEGRNLASLIDSGCTVGISARGTGDLDGDYVIPDSYQFKCFDITFRPSDPNARLIPLTESEKTTKIIFKESELTDTLILGSDTDKTEVSEEDVRYTILNLLKLALEAQKDESYTFSIDNTKNVLNVLKNDSIIETITSGVFRSENGDITMGVYASPIFGIEYVKNVKDEQFYRELASRIFKLLKEEI